MRSLDGTPIAGARLDVWQNDETVNLYPVQDPDAPEQHLRGLFETRDDGSYAFLALRPTDYTIPEDGPVGAMIARHGPPRLAPGAPARHRERAGPPHAW